VNEAIKMIAKRILMFSSIIVALLLPASAEQQGPNPTIADIRAEGLRSWETSVIFHTLTDMIGARLTYPRRTSRPLAGRWSNSRSGDSRMRAWSRLNSAKDGRLKTSQSR
jgi:hypothetical protein